MRWLLREPGAFGRVLQSRWVERTWCGLLVLCALAAVRTLLRAGAAPLDSFDEALLLVNGELLHGGKLIFRDFFANYPPGIYQLTRAFLALGLPAIWATRWLGFVVRLATALLAARIGGLGQGKRWCWLTGVSVLALQSALGVVPFAHNVAVILVELLVLGVATGSGRRIERVALGMLLAVLSYFRVDVFAYLGASLLGLELVWGLLRKRSFLFRRWTEYGETVAVAAVATALLWAPILAAAGWSRVLHDLVLDVSQLAMPARVLPFPPLFAPTKASLTFSIWIVCLAVAAWGLGSSLRGRSPTSNERMLWSVAAGAVVTIPAALGRSDYPHLVYGLPLWIPLAALSMPGRWRVLAAPTLALLSLAVTLRAAEGPARSVSWLWAPRADTDYMPEDVGQLTRAIDREVPPDEPLFVGCDSHRQHLSSSLEVYYFSHRPGATRYMQFDPGLTTSEPVHREMIADLERTRPKLFVQTKRCYWDEPNASRELGSELLDQYLTQRYQPYAELPRFVLWRRRDDR